MAKPELRLWADTLLDIAGKGYLSNTEQVSLRAIANELIKFQAVVEVTKEENNG